MLQLTTIFFLVTFTLLAVLHNIAMKLYLYWQIEWLDIPMHIFGGAVIALGVYTLRDLGLVKEKWLTLIKVLIIVLLIALVWEAFEIFAGVPIAGNFYTDTATDIVMGLVGGWVGFYVGKQLSSL